MSLRLENITLNIGNKTVCKDLSLQFKPGEVWGILGPNGIGKTTFLNSLLNLKKPQNGTIFLNEQPLKSFKQKSLAREMGLLLQNHEYTFPNTVAEVIKNGAYANAAATVKSVGDILSDLQLTHLTHKSVLQLSGGEKRLVDFATLLLQNPQHYLLDEPTNHLDLKYQQLLLSKSKDLSKQGKTLIISTHDINLANRYCDKILMLFGNGLSLTGDTQAILQQEELEKLYQCRIKKITQTAKDYWQHEV